MRPDRRVLRADPVEDLLGVVLPALAAGHRIRKRWVAVVPVAHRRPADADDLGDLARGDEVLQPGRFLVRLDVHLAAFAHVVAHDRIPTRLVVN